MFVFKDSKQKALCNLILKSYFAKIAQDEAMTDFNLSELRDLNRKIKVESVIRLEIFEKHHLMNAIDLFAKMLKKGELAYCSYMVDDESELIDLYSLVQN